MAKSNSSGSTTNTTSTTHAPSSGSAKDTPTTTHARPLDLQHEKDKRETARPRSAASETEPGGTARRVSVVTFYKPVKPFEDTSATYTLKTDSRITLTLENGMVIGTMAGKTPGTTAGVAWPGGGDTIREIRFAETPGVFTPEARESSSALRKGHDDHGGVGSQAHAETPQGAGAPQATSGEAVSNTGVRGSGRNLPPKEGESPEDQGHAPSEEASDDDTSR